MKLKQVNWPIFTFISIYHVLLAIGLPFYLYFFNVSWALCGIAFFLFVATGISITGGYHRFYSHRTYKANKIVEATLLFFGTMAGQGSALRWSHDHRIHHAHVDTEKDPYSIQKGFLHAHILWLFKKPAPIEPRVVSDLLKNKMVVFQHKYYGVLFLATNIGSFLLTGWLLNDYLGAFVITWWARLCLLHHSTWFINSLAHTWGSKSYCKEISAVDNYIISLLTFGEGYHNYHHSFATDYRNGIKWYHFDPTKWMIWSLSKIGFTGQLKRIDKYKAQKRIIKKDKDILLDWIREIPYIKVEVLEEKIQKVAEDISRKISEMSNLKNLYLEYKKECMEKQVLKNLKKEIRELKKNIYRDWKEWGKLFNDIMEIRPISC